MSDRRLCTRFACNRGDWIAMTCNVPEGDAVRRADMMELGETASVWVPNEDAARAPELVEEVERLREAIENIVAAHRYHPRDLEDAQAHYGTLIAEIDNARALLPETKEE